MVVYRIRGLDETIKKLKPELVGKPARDFFGRIGITVQSRARENAPVDTGRLRSDISYNVDPRDVPTFVLIGTNVLYAPFMEHGTGLFAEGGARGRHFPPGEALGRWASRHGFASGYQVARIIGNRGGLRPRRFLNKAAENTIPDVEGFMREMEKEIAENWERDQ